MNIGSLIAHLGVDTSGLRVAKREFDRFTNQVNTRLNSIKRVAGSLSGVLAGMGAAWGAREVLRTADTYNELTGRLQLVTRSASELADVQEQLFSIARESRVAYAQTVDLYTRLTRSTQELNLSQEQLYRITEAVNKSLIISGASAEAAQAALIQLGQGLASGTLRGEELNSVLEQAPRLAEAIAKGMGVTIGELRQLGSEGKLTAEAVVKALESQAGAIEAEFERMPKTIGQALTVINNSIGHLIFGVDQAGGVTGALAERIIDLADNIDDWAAANDKVVGQKIDEYLDNIGDSLSAIVDVYNSIPDEITSAAGYGIVGAALFGGKAGFIIGTLALTDKLAENVGANLGTLYDKWKDFDASVRKLLYEKGPDGYSLIDILGGHFDFKTLSWEIPTITPAAAGTRPAHYLELPPSSEWPGKPAPTPTITKPSVYETVFQEMFGPPTDVDAIRAFLEGNERDFKAMLNAERTAYQQFLEGNQADALAMAGAQAEIVEKMTSDWERSWDQLAQLQVDAYRRMESAAGDFFFDVMQGRFDNLLDGFLNMTNRMVSEWLAVQAMMGLFGENFTSTGILGGFFGKISNAMTFSKLDTMTAGLEAFYGSSTNKFDSGGWVTEPVVGVGLRTGAGYSFAENGPEFVANPRRGQLGGDTYNINIMAVDSKSFADLARRNPQAIIGPFREALRRGDRGLRADLAGAI